jgi:hypothetical protein
LDSGMGLRVKPGQPAMPGALFTGIQPCLQGPLYRLLPAVYGFSPKQSEALSGFSGISLYTIPYQVGPLGRFGHPSQKWISCTVASVRWPTTAKFLPGPALTVTGTPLSSRTLPQGSYGGTYSTLTKRVAVWGWATAASVRMPIQSSASRNLGTFMKDKFP